ncbi:MAG: hydrogenase maturation nickel metallochaperone HypA [Sandaracinaceae bacterium]|nr:hydrogenase maturation nickel metallochaperone HypA [Sandaracinaceae bacterium]
MHELALMQSLVATVEEQVADRVTRVRLEIGRLTAVVPDALRFCFDVCARGTRLEGAVLEIVDVAPRARCAACGREDEIESDLLLRCACGSADLSLLAGEELRIAEVEVS